MSANNEPPLARASVPSRQARSLAPEPCSCTLEARFPRSKLGSLKGGQGLNGTGVGAQAPSGGLPEGVEPPGAGVRPSDGLTLLQGLEAVEQLSLGLLRPRGGGVASARPPGPCGGSSRRSP